MDGWDTGSLGDKGALALRLVMGTKRRRRRRSSITFGFESPRGGTGTSPPLPKASSHGRARASLTSGTPSLPALFHHTTT